MIAWTTCLRAVAMFSIFGLAACSIKEDRTSCPCFLNLDFDAVPEGSGFDKSIAVIEASSAFSCEELFTRDWKGQRYEVAVPRGAVRMAAVFGYEGFRLSSDTLRMVGGNTVAGRIFVWSEMAQCNDDSYSCQVRPHKQFCDITVRMANGDGHSLGKCRPVIRAGYDALSLFDLRAAGEACAIVSELNDEGDGYLLRVPRQRPGPLVLELYFDGPDDPATVPTMAFDIAPALEAKGYDWYKEDLDDVELVLDVSSADFSVNVEEWTVDAFIRVEI